MEISPEKRKLIFLGLGFFIFLIFFFLVFTMPERAKKRYAEKIKKEYQSTTEAIARMEKEIEPLQKIVKEDEILSQCQVDKDVEVEGIKIEEKEGTKIIKNEKYGYRIEVPSDFFVVRTLSAENLLLARANKKNNVCFPLQDNFFPDIELLVLENEKNLSLKDFVKEDIEKNVYLEEAIATSSIVKTKINEKEAFKFFIKNSSPFPQEVFYYFSLPEKKVLQVSFNIWEKEPEKPRLETLEKILQTLSF